MLVKLNALLVKNNHSKNHSISLNRLQMATSLQCWIIKVKMNLQSHTMFIDNDFKQKGCFYIILESTPIIHISRKHANLRFTE